MRNLDYTVRIHKSNHLEAEAWCRERLGPRWEVTGNREGLWCCFWAGPRAGAAAYDYHFANEADMIWFKLTWA